MEEDIMIVEELLQGAKDNGMYDNNKYFYSIENLIKGYRKLEKENDSKEKAYNDCYCEFKHYKQYESIPKSKVKEVIEELNEEYERKITEDNINHFVYSEQYAIAEEYLKKLMEDK